MRADPQKFGKAGGKARAVRESCGTNGAENKPRTVLFRGQNHPPNMGHVNGYQEKVASNEGLENLTRRFNGMEQVCSRQDRLGTIFASLRICRRLHQSDG